MSWWRRTMRRTWQRTGRSGGRGGGGGTGGGGGEKMAYKAINQSLAFKVESQTKLPFKQLMRRSYSPFMWPAVKQRPNRHLTLALNRRQLKHFFFLYYSISCPFWFYYFLFCFVCFIFFGWDQPLKCNRSNWQKFLNLDQFTILAVDNERIYFTACFYPLVTANLFDKL